MLLFDANYIYVKVFKNKFELNYLNKELSETIHATTPFSTERLLIGQFEVAEACLQKGIQKLLSNRLFATSPIVVIQPMEMIENGISQVEERVLREVAIGAGARKTFVWVGDELSNDKLHEKIQNEFK